VIDPLIELKKALGKVRHLLIYYACEMHTPVPGDEERCKKASDAFRLLSSEISSLMESIPFHDFISRISRGYVPSRLGIQAACSALIGVSNTVLSRDRQPNTRREADINRALWQIESLA
jgi:hypothetical protein